MARVNVKNEIKVYEVNGKDVPPQGSVSVWVESHWNDRDFVVLLVEGRKFTVGLCR